MASVEVRREGRVTTVILNRPEVMNALDPAAHEALEAAFTAFADDPDQWVCVVTGAGDRAFCAGSDLKAAAATGEPPVYPEHGYAGLVERFDCDKPFIAAVNGVALGGGFEIALACDIIVAVEGASFGLPEPLVGAVALGGGLHRLVRQIPLKRAMGAILASRRLSADEGHALGFVNEVVPAGKLAASVARWCSDILSGSPVAVRTSKAVIRRGLAEPDAAAAIRHQAGYPEFAAWRASDDYREGPRAFAEKRPPRWSGR